MPEHKYKIPLLHIQDVLLLLPGRLVGINAALDSEIKKNRVNWGIGYNESGYEVKYELENRWYPVYVTDSRWVAKVLLDIAFKETRDVSNPETCLHDYTNGEHIRNTCKHCGKHILED